jgi:MSHA biogenesis protein MshI
MGLFSRTKKTAGWLAINFAPQGALFVHILRLPAGKPMVTLAALHADGLSDKAALESLCKEMSVSQYDCTTLLSPSEYQLLVVDAPKVASDELKSTIRWSVKDMLDYHIDEATVDTLEIPRDSNAVGKPQSLYVVAARNAVIQERISVCEKVGIPVSVVDIPELAQRNIAALLETEGRGLALLSFDEGGGLLTFTAGGELVFSRRMDISLAQLTQPESVHRTHFFDRVALEVQRSLDHFERQFYYITLSALMIAPIPEPIGLQEHLAASLYLPVSRIDLSSVLDFDKVPELLQPEQQALYFYTLGAALRLEKQAS